GADLVRAAYQALAKAQEEVDAQDEMVNALGMGEGIQDGSITQEEIAQVFSRVKDDEFLRRLFEAAGRDRRFAQGAQRNKIDHGFDDMVDITVSGDPSKILDSELALLLDEDLELEGLLKIDERRAMARKYRGIDKVGKGPIVVVVDESGS